MVRTEQNAQTVQNLFKKIQEQELGDKIEIASDFQRGDEATGVWSRKQQQKFIDSLKKSFPTGILTFVKDRITATSYQNPWKVLDGGNRLRAMRDYMEDKFVDLDGKKFTELEPQESANFNTIIIPCQHITIERDDPNDTIAQMFCRLNTSASALSQGELFKAHGWKKNCWEIELAKKFIGDTWGSHFSDNQNRIDDIREQWVSVFGEIGETKRCDSLAMMLGYILSAKTGQFEYFDKRYKKLSGLLSGPDVLPTGAELACIYNKLEEFCHVMENIYSSAIFGRITKGIPSQAKIAPIWYKICDNTMDEEFKQKIIGFYSLIDEDVGVRNQYFNLLTEGGNSETTNAKINRVLTFINETIN